jgi:predicted lipid-binding transport protein (Tim44 family)
MHPCGAEWNSGMMTTASRFRRLRAALVLAAAFTLVASSVDARPGRGGGGFGSRGARTFQVPQATPTAPRPAAPIERSVTPQPARPTANAAAQQRPVAAAPTTGGLGMRGGFMGGLLGAGLFGMLLGYGFAGGLGGLGSILGLLLQVGLVVLLVGFAFRAFQAFQRRAQPAYAGAGPTPRGSTGVGSGGPRPSRPSAVRDEVGIRQSDLSEFERLLGTVQMAYGSEDAAALREATTPEVAAELEGELAENRARGVINRVRDVRLEQGDLAEAWRENGSDYATVAMRFSHIDHTDDRDTGRTVEGDPNNRTEATEVWTFTRPRGGKWRLSAIQPV